MSRLEELIQELCPDGVPFIKITKCVKTIDKIKGSDTLPSDVFKYMDLSSVDRDTHLIFGTTKINKETAPSRAQQIVQTGDILFGTTRPMLKRYCIVPKEYNGQICSTGFCVLRANEKILSHYLYHIVGSSNFFDYIEAKQSGASYPAIADKLVKQIKIPAW